MVIDEFSFCKMSQMMSQSNSKKSRITLSIYLDTVNERIYVDVVLKYIEKKISLSNPRIGKPQKKLFF